MSRSVWRSAAPVVTATVAATVLAATGAAAPAPKGAVYLGQTSKHGYVQLIVRGQKIVGGKIVMPIRVVLQGTLAGGGTRPYPVPHVSFRNGKATFRYHWAEFDRDTTFSAKLGAGGATITGTFHVTQRTPQTRSSLEAGPVTFKATRKTAIG